jgi:hypothetical protein
LLRRSILLDEPIATARRVDQTNFVEDLPLLPLAAARHYRPAGKSKHEAGA